MAGAKLVVIYPQPKDLDAFEQAYRDEHLPIAKDRIEGKTKIVFTKIVGAPNGTPAFHRMAEIHFESMAALQSSLASDGTQEAARNAVAISNGGAPIFLVSEEETLTF